MTSIENPSLQPEINTPETQKTYLTRDWGGENVLQVYPRTFKEVRADGEPAKGIGSIKGITSELDWMKQTGVTAIWLGPIYKSPHLDGNYDITDYRQIDEDLGNIADVEELIRKAHERDLRVIFDLVPNHTSDQSEWFKASSDPSHRDHEKYKDYYIWRDPAKGELPRNIVAEDRLEGLPPGMTVPNNWSSIFSLPQIDKVRAANGGIIPKGAEIPAVTAWVWNKERQQFYLAEFLKEQPSLNHANPAVRAEIKDVIRFWLNKGVDGFRVDVINHIGKDPSFSDEEPAEVGEEIGQYNPGVSNPHDQWKQEKLVSHWPQLGLYANDLLSVSDEADYENRNVRFIFEDWMSALDHDDRLNKLRPNLANVFNFEFLLNTNRDNWSADNFTPLIRNYYSQMAKLPGAIPNQVSGNHDVDTLRTRLGSVSAARAAYMMIAMLPGTLYTWQGDVMLRPNAIIPKELQKDGDVGLRDGERIPMQWDSSKNGGFSSADPANLWLPTVDEKYLHGDNLELEEGDPRSPYRLIRAIMQKRASDPALRSGSLRQLHTDNPNVLAFARADPENPRRQVISLTNFSAQTTEVSISDAMQAGGKITLSSLTGKESEEVDLTRPITMPPDASYLIG